MSHSYAFMVAETVFQRERVNFYFFLDVMKKKCKGSPISGVGSSAMTRLSTPATVVRRAERGSLWIVTGEWAAHIDQAAPVSALVQRGTIETLSAR